MIILLSKRKNQLIISREKNLKKKRIEKGKSFLRIEKIKEDKKD